MHTIVPKQNETLAYAEHGTQLFEVDENVEQTLRKRLVEATGRKGKAFKLHIEKTGVGSFYSLCDLLKLRTDEEFVNQSQRIADLLANSQSSSNYPGGFLLIVEGLDEESGKTWYTAIKAEPHEALIRSLQNGRSKIEVLDQIFLSPTQKLFKIGMLQELELEAENPNQKYNCYLFDDQFSSTSKPAAYFYEQFLGYSIDFNSEIQSMRFYTLSEDFIKRSKLDSEQKESVLEALKTELDTSLVPNIRPQAFSEEYFSDDETKRLYMEQVSAKLPDNFVKNTSLLKTRFSTKKIDFPSKIKITGPDENFDRQVKIIKNQEALDNLRATNENFTIVVILGKPYHG